LKLLDIPLEPTKRINTFPMADVSADDALILIECADTYVFEMLAD
jgi:hypothetical protein